jgi:hypothetical protein
MMNMDLQADDQLRKKDKGIATLRNAARAQRNPEASVMP